MESLEEAAHVIFIRCAFAASRLYSGNSSCFGSGSQKLATRPIPKARKATAAAA
jgi:hypothetical protein